MSGADRAATTSVGKHRFVDLGRESDFPVLATIPSARAPRGGPLCAARQILSGSSGSVHAGVC